MYRSFLSQTRGPEIKNFDTSLLTFSIIFEPCWRCWLCWPCWLYNIYIYILFKFPHTFWSSIIGRPAGPRNALLPSAPMCQRIMQRTKASQPSHCVAHNVPRTTAKPARLQNSEKHKQICIEVFYLRPAGLR